MASILMGGHGAGRATPAPPSTLLATQWPAAHAAALQGHASRPFVAVSKWSSLALNGSKRAVGRSCAPF